MPELPEVETVVRDLRPHLTGRRIVRVRTGRQSRSAAPGPPTGRTDSPAGRSRPSAAAASGSCSTSTAGLLVVHLGMTGQLTVGAADRPVEDHTHLVVDLDDGRQLRFRDVRRFGSVTVLRRRGRVGGVLRRPAWGRSRSTSAAAEFRRALAATARPLKAVLLDQRVVAGVGNIYADESLFEARLPPAQLGRATTPAEAERLRKADRHGADPGDRAPRLDHPRLRRRRRAARGRTRTSSASTAAPASPARAAARRSRASAWRGGRRTFVRSARRSRRSVRATGRRPWASAADSSKTLHYVLPRLQTSARRNQPGAEVPLPARRRSSCCSSPAASGCTPGRPRSSPTSRRPTAAGCSSR